MPWWNNIKTADSPYYRNLLKTKPKQHTGDPITEDAKRLFNMIKRDKSLTATFYHGTAELYYEQALKNGYLSAPSLRRDEDGQLMSKREHRKAGLNEVFYTTYVNYALYYAYRGKEQSKTPALILELEIPLFYIKEVSDVILNTEKNLYNEYNINHHMRGLIDEAKNDQEAINKILEYVINSYRGGNNEWTTKYLCPVKFIKRTTLYDASLSNFIGSELINNNSDESDIRQFEDMIPLDIKKRNPHLITNLSEARRVREIRDLLNDAGGFDSKEMKARIVSLFQKATPEDIAKLYPKFMEFLKKYPEIFSAFPTNLQNEPNLIKACIEGIKYRLTRNIKLAVTQSYPPSVWVAGFAELKPIILKTLTDSIEEGFAETKTAVINMGEQNPILLNDDDFYNLILNNTLSVLQDDTFSAHRLSEFTGDIEYIVPVKIPQDMMTNPTVQKATRECILACAFKDPFNFLKYFPQLRQDPEAMGNIKKGAMLPLGAANGWTFFSNLPEELKKDPEILDVTQTGVALTFQSSPFLPFQLGTWENSKDTDQPIINGMVRKAYDTFGEQAFANSVSSIEGVNDILTNVANYPDDYRYKQVMSNPQFVAAMKKSIITSILSEDSYEQEKGVDTITTIGIGNLGDQAIDFFFKDPEVKQACLKGVPQYLLRTSGAYDIYSRRPNSSNNSRRNVMNSFLEEAIASGDKSVYEAVIQSFMDRSVNYGAIGDEAWERIPKIFRADPRLLEKAANGAEETLSQMHVADDYHLDKIPSQIKELPQVSNLIKQVQMGFEERSSNEGFTLDYLEAYMAQTGNAQKLWAQAKTNPKILDPIKKLFRNTPLLELTNLLSSRVSYMSNFGEFLKEFLFLPDMTDLTLKLGDFIVNRDSIGLAIRVLNAMGMLKYRDIVASFIKRVGTDLERANQNKTFEANVIGYWSKLPEQVHQTPHLINLAVQNCIIDAERFLASRSDKDLELTAGFAQHLTRYPSDIVRTPKFQQYLNNKKTTHVPTVTYQNYYKSYFPENAKPINHAKPTPTNQLPFLNQPKPKVPQQPAIANGWYGLAKTADDDYLALQDFKNPEQVYTDFKNTYDKATGVSWDKDKFFRKALDWRFYGDEAGYISVREQKSGMLKLTGMSGSMKGIYKGMLELKQESAPVWGMVAINIAQMAKKAGFLVPPPELIKNNIQRIPPEVFGGAKILNIQDDGGVIFQYADVGIVTKYLICNQAYMGLLGSMA